MAVADRNALSATSCSLSRPLPCCTLSAIERDTKFNTTFEKGASSAALLLTRQHATANGRSPIGSIAICPLVPENVILPRRLPPSAGLHASTASRSISAYGSRGLAGRARPIVMPSDTSFPLTLNSLLCTSFMSLAAMLSASSAWNSIVGRRKTRLRSCESVWHLGELLCPPPQKTGESLHLHHPWPYLSFTFFFEVVKIGEEYQSCAARKTGERIFE